jgi:hypothetical protein
MLPTFRYIFHECAQNLRELYIHNYHGGKEGFPSDNLSRLKLEKLFLVAMHALPHRFLRVLNPEDPEIGDAAAPRIRSLSVHGMYAPGDLKQLIELCEARSKMDHPFQEISVGYHRGFRVSDVREWIRMCASPLPIHVEKAVRWERHLMELPAVCTDERESWWPSWETGFGLYSSGS